MKSLFHGTVIAIAMIAAVVFNSTVHAADTIKVGILHSLSGTMAISVKGRDVNAHRRTK